MNEMKALLNDLTNTLDIIIITDSEEFTKSITIEEKDILEQAKKILERIWEVI